MPGSAVVTNAGVKLFLAGGQAGLALCKRSDHLRLVFLQMRLCLLCRRIHTRLEAQQCDSCSSIERCVLSRDWLRD